MKKIFTCILVLALLAGALALPASAAVPQGYASGVLRLVNEERAKQGLSALKGDHTKLNAAAQKRAEEITVVFNQAHTRPNGTQCYTVLQEYGVSYSAAGENIAYGYPTAEAVMSDWMSSSGHRKNILGAYTHVGVGVVESGGLIYCVQVFISDGTSQAKPSGSASANRWDSWPPALQWLLKWLAFGWIWM